MPDSILVTFATRYGSTQQVAETITATLRERGLETELVPARQVQTLEGYRGVVLGAPIYIGSLHKDASRFLLRHQQALARNFRVAVFALGPTRTDDEELRSAREQLDKEMAKFPWLAPVALHMFGGKYDPARLRFPDNILASLPASPLHGLPASDARDWNAIRTWAGDLAARGLL